jgi:hypothetical protein
MPPLLLERSPPAKTLSARSQAHLAPALDENGKENRKQKTKKHSQPAQLSPSTFFVKSSQPAPNSATITEVLRYKLSQTKKYETQN